MAIMAMDTVKKSKLALTIATSLLVGNATAGEWQFTPSLSVNEIFTDNVNLTNSNNQSSLVSQAGVDLSSSYESKLLNFNFSSNSVYAMYSHDHELDNDYHTLSSDFNLKLGRQGFALIGDINVDNRSRNNARNSLADIVSADTVQVERYSGGVAYNVSNSRFNINSNIKYNLTNSEDDIGNFEGYSSTIAFKNGTANTSVFWDINGQYQERKNQNQTAQSYRGEIKVGFITTWKLNPFLRYYDEDNSGTIQTGSSTESNSYGAGIRWLVTPRLYIDLSYNTPIGNSFNLDGSKQKNYFDTSINWQPSVRTTLNANYSQRFFGDTYGLDFTHRNKRLTNKISYQEEVRSFTRSNYQVNPLGTFWCPIVDTLDLNSCFAQSDQIINFDNFQLVTINDFELIQDNVFSLYKTLAWNSELKLARTSFNFVAELSNREDLETGNEDDKTYLNFTASRAVSGRSNVKLNMTFTDNWLRKNTDIERRDRYRQLSISYNKLLNSRLSFDFDIGHVNRSSNISQFNYEEGRVTLKFTKDF